MLELWPSAIHKDFTWPPSDPRFVATLHIYFNVIDFSLVGPVSFPLLFRRVDSFPSPPSSFYEIGEERALVEERGLRGLVSWPNSAKRLIGFVGQERRCIVGYCSAILHCGMLLFLVLETTTKIKTKCYAWSILRCNNEQQCLLFYIDLEAKKGKCFMVLFFCLNCFDRLSCGRVQLRWPRTNCLRLKTRWLRLFSSLWWIAVMYPSNKVI
jgi:hypothetical protein